MDRRDYLTALACLSALNAGCAAIDAPQADAHPTAPVAKSGGFSTGNVPTATKAYIPIAGQTRDQ